MVKLVNYSKDELENLLKNVCVRASIHYEGKHSQSNYMLGFSNGLITVVSQHFTLFGVFTFMPPLSSRKGEETLRLTFFKIPKCSPSI